MKPSLVKFIALTATGLVAGAFFYASMNLLPTFYEVPLNVHLVFRTHLMTHNGISMQIVMILSIILPLWYARLNRRTIFCRNFAILAASLAFSSLLVTRLGNVPINLNIRAWDPFSPPENWVAILHKWDIYHLIRTITGIGCHLAFIGATFYEGKNKSASIAKSVSAAA